MRRVIYLSWACNVSLLLLLFLADILHKYPAGDGLVAHH